MACFSEVGVHLPSGFRALVSGMFPGAWFGVVARQCVPYGVALGFASWAPAFPASSNVSGRCFSDGHRLGLVGSVFRTPRML